MSVQNTHSQLHGAPTYTVHRFTLQLSQDWCKFDRICLARRVQKSVTASISVFHEAKQSQNITFSVTAMYHSVSASLVHASGAKATHHLPLLTGQVHRQERQVPPLPNPPHSQCGEALSVAAQLLPESARAQVRQSRMGNKRDQIAPIRQTQATER